MGSRSVKPQSVTRLLSSTPPASTALFLDFDGVLVDLAGRPEYIEVPNILRPALNRLEAATGQALAVVSGRYLEDLRQYLPDVPKTIVASHGAERALAGQDVISHPLLGTDAVARLHRIADSFSDTIKGVVLEKKPLGVVLHYRETPLLEESLHRASRCLISILPDFEIHRAKCAFEIRPRNVSKRQAVIDLMQSPPFKERLPVYIGDDRTDEPALGWVAEQGGIAIKVGEGETLAPYRLGTPKEVIETLMRWLDEMEEYGCQAV